MNRTRTKRKPSRASIGGWSLLIAVLALAGLTALPANYVIQRPGSTVNTLGDVTMANGETRPMIQINDAETFPTDGALDLTTVWVRGSRDFRPTWLELAFAWANSSEAVRPIDDVFPPDVTKEENDERNAQMMTDSKSDAAAAALGYLDFDTNPRVAVVAVEEELPAFGLVEPGDIVLKANGHDVSVFAELIGAVTDSKGTEMTLELQRGDEVVTVQVTPASLGTPEEPLYRLGILTQQTYDLPIDITLQLDNIGGPSAGMMFALGIIDTMTPGEMTGGRHIAGTGTIDGAGNVGPIGGIRQKLYGARDAGAEYFLAPIANCNEVVGHVPAGLQVFATDNLADAAAAVETIGAGGATDALLTCELALESATK